MSIIFKTSWFAMFCDLFSIKLFMCSILLTANWNYIKLLIPQIKPFDSADRTRTDFYFMKCVILYIDEPTLTDIMLKEIPSCTAQQRTDSWRCFGVHTKNDVLYKML